MRKVLLIALLMFCLMSSSAMAANWVFVGQIVENKFSADISMDTDTMYYYRSKDMADYWLRGSNGEFSAYYHFQHVFNTGMSRMVESGRFDISTGKWIGKSGTDWNTGISKVQQLGNDFFVRNAQLVKIIN